MIGIVLLDDLYNSSISKEGGDTNSEDNFSYTNSYAENNTLSGLTVLIRIIFLKQSHLVSHSPGNGSISG